MQSALKKALCSAALLFSVHAAHTAQATEILSLSQVQPDPAAPSAALDWQLDEATLTVLANAAMAAPPSMQAISAVPEPPVYIMLLVGVGLVGLAARRQTPPPKFTDDKE